jgi:hypothetical protein
MALLCGEWLPRHTAFDRRERAAYRNSYIAANNGPCPNRVLAKACRGDHVPSRPVQCAGFAARYLRPCFGTLDGRPVLIAVRARTAVATALSLCAAKPMMAARNTSLFFATNPLAIQRLFKIAIRS